MIIRIGLVKLEHGELRIMLCARTFIAKITIDLIHAIKPTHHQPLQIKLRCNAQIQRHIKRIVMGRERSRRGATRDRLQHRCFDFQIPARVEELTQRPQHTRPLDKHITHRDLAWGAFVQQRIHEQINIPLPIPQLDISQTGKLIRQREHGF